MAGAALGHRNAALERTAAVRSMCQVSHEATRYSCGMNRTAAAPFAGLTPDAIADAVESVGVQCDGRVLALNSYENRVFRIGIEDGPPLVAKFYRPGRWSDAAIAEEHGFAAELVEAGLSVVAPLRYSGSTLHRFEGWRFALFPLQGGHAPEPGDAATLRQIGRTLGRMHAVGASRRFRHRPMLDPAVQGRQALQALSSSPRVPAELRQNLATLGELLLARIDDAWRGAAAHSIRIHGDVHPGNLLWRDGKAHFVDLDDCLTAPAMQDLWMLLSGPRHEQEAQLALLLEGYGMFGDFDPGELRLIEPLRALRLLHYHGWVVQRWHDPAFPAAFPWFGERRHWEGLIGQMQEQLADLDEPPLQWR
jgi:Ser/Thr protein kinase RdoA (MazF antagonist)